MSMYLYFYLRIPKLQIHVGFQLTKTDVFSRVYEFLSNYVHSSFKICLQDRNISKDTTVEKLLPYVLTCTKGRLPVTKDSAVKLWLRFPGKNKIPQPPPPIWTKKICNAKDIQHANLERAQQHEALNNILPPEIVSMIMSYVPYNITYVYIPHIIWYDWYDWREYDSD